MATATTASLLSDGVLVGKPTYPTNDTTRCYPLYAASPAEYIPIICQTPWLVLPSNPRPIARKNGGMHSHSHARAYAFRMAFCEPELGTGTEQEAESWPFFLGRFQAVLRKWLQKREPSATFAKIRWVEMLDESAATEYSFIDSPQVQQQQQQQQQSARQPPSTSTVRWTIRTQLSNRVGCFDMQQKAVPVDDILTSPSQKQVRFLLRFTNMWVNEQSLTAGVGIHILQIQQHDTRPFETFAFAAYPAQTPTATATTTTTTTTTATATTRSVSTQTERVERYENETGYVGTAGAVPITDQADRRAVSAADTRCDHPVYGVYFKMLKKRVPKPAVQHKMRMNGLDPNLLDLEPHETLPGGDGDSPPQVRDQLALSLQADSASLRKTEPNSALVVSRTNPNRSGQGFSLDEIVSGLNSLRKTFFKFDTPAIASQPTTGTRTITDAPSTTNRNSQPASARPPESSFMRLLGATFR
jgi:hypothetical protein